MLEEKDLTYNQEDKYYEPIMYEEVHTLVENDHLHLDQIGIQLLSLEACYVIVIRVFPCQLSQLLFQRLKS